MLEQIPAPSAADMAQASGVSKQAAEDWDNYCRKCRRRFTMLATRINDYFTTVSGDMRGLDWGSAAGGVAILIDDNFPLQMHAADVDEHSINWLRTVAPHIDSTVLPSAPPLPWPDRQFDLVYGISVLTHLPAEQQEPFLAELARICRPGALVVLTVASYFAIRRNNNTGRSIRIADIDAGELRRAGVIYREYADEVLDKIAFARAGGYGMTAHSREYVEDVFAKYFSIRDIEEGGLGYQDVVTLAVPAGG